MLEIVQCTDTSSVYTLWQWVEKELSGIEIPGKDLHGAWSRWNGAPAKSATSNQSSLHACTSHYQPCETRHLCLLIICCRLLSFRVILSQQNIYHKRIRRSRKLSDRHQGVTRREILSQYAVSFHRCSPGPWDDGSFPNPCDQFSILPGVPFYVSSGTLGSFTFADMEISKQESQ